ncbi:hypothetical protein WR25_01703 [Diploscapter pachys]|uniref:Fatty acid desaturase domain-containing protein n=1 Tax=Diploscapter pachys TaxID=2018661 RepID=A0A2A2JSJ1_9BILA|nr:hypothetical protein WR25_01703 [Diploscapter pachys]
MVIRSVDRDSPFHIKVDGQWLKIDESFMKMHPGGTVITTYRNKEASTIFHTFHVNSKTAYQWLQKLKEENKGLPEPTIKEEKEDKLLGYDDINIENFDISEERSQKISENFEKFRIKVRQLGLLKGNPFFYIRKVVEALLTMGLAIFLQSTGYYIASALLMGLAWQQLGWLIHEFAHHQLFTNHYYNDLASYFVGNFLQGFSSCGWKEQHNVHHAATNVVGRDGDLDLMPFFATLAKDLKLADAWLLYILPYQHIYWSLMLPFLRLSWLMQSVQFVRNMKNSFYDYHRERAIYEQVALTGHWILVAIQLYFLPDVKTMLIFFLVSQLTGGFLLAHVVTYNHYSVPKYDCEFSNSKMIEHHLFPTMPRHNLNKVMPMVQEFCKENDLPYMQDGYFKGWRLGVEQFENVAKVAEKLKSKIA